MTRLVWVSSTMAPICVFGSSGSPGIIFWPIAITLARNSSLILSSTIRREPAVQTSPWLNQMPKAVRRAAMSRLGASASTMFGDLPPHSSQTCFMLDSPE